MQVKVYAKLNLTLGVGARVGEFHEIDSVATSVDVCDVVEVVARTDGEVRVSGVAGVEVERNTAYRAARAFVEAFCSNGVDICIQKGIPFGGGLGGSSADAAAVLFCMCKLFGVDVESDGVRSICTKIGSDITYMLRGGLGRLRGKGDSVGFFSLKHPLYLALTIFDQQMTSREVYTAFDSVVKPSRRVINDGGTKRQFEDNRSLELLNLLADEKNEQALSCCFNDLQRAAVHVSSYADEYLKFTKSHGLNAVMTGSGSAYYVAFATVAEAQKAVDLLNSNGFTTTLCQTVPQGVEIV